MCKSGRMFRGLLLSRDLSTDELAAGLGISRDALNNRIRGLTPWLWKEVVQVCRLLDITYKDFEEVFA